MPRGSGKGRTGGGRFNNLPDYGFSNQNGRGYGGQSNSRNFSSDSVWANNTPNNYSNYGGGGGSGSYGQNNYGQNGGSYGGGGHNSNGYGQNNSGYSNNSDWDNYGQQSRNKAGGGGGGSASGSDDILKELGKCFLSSFSGDGGSRNQLMGFMNQSNMGAFGNNPSRYDGYYSNGNQYQAYGYQGGYGQRSNYGRYGNQIGFRKYNQAGRGGGKKQVGKQQVNKPSLKAKDKAGAKSSISRRLKDRYKSFANNKFVGEENIPLVLFLKTIFSNLCEESDKDHCLLISRFLFRHHNAVKLLTYECKLALDKKFGQENTEEVKTKKLDYLKKQKATFMTDLKKIKKNKEDPKMPEKEKVIDDAFDVLTGEKFTSDNVPNPEDYVTSSEKTETDFALDFQFCFIKNCYDKFNIRIFDPFKSKNNENRLKFHLNNGFIPLILIEKVKSKAPLKVPASLSKYAKECSKDIKEKMEATNKLITAKVEANNQLIQSDIADFIGNEKLGTEVLRDFADCIILFDKLASVIKHKLLNYTQYINLSRDIKEGIFNELVKSVYTECLTNLKNGVRLDNKTYEDMDKPVDEDEVVAKLAESKEAAAAAKKAETKMEVE